MWVGETWPAEKPDYIQFVPQKNQLEVDGGFRKKYIKKNNNNQIRGRGFPGYLSFDSLLSTLRIG